MKQVAILPSGVQNHSKNGPILYFDENRILYASTLAVYVLNSKSFLLEKILSLNTRAIYSITVSPFDTNLLVVGGSDASICLWNIEEEEVIRKINTLNGAVLVSWDPFSKDHCAVVSHETNLKFFYWDVRRASGGCLVEMFSIKNTQLKCTIAKWNQNVEGQIAVGCNNGAVILFNHIDKVQKLLQHPENGGNAQNPSPQPVVDIQFDRLSQLYMIVAYTHFMSLWDLESCTEIHMFDKQPVPITSIAWLDWTTGNFMSTNSKNNSFKVWNASQKAPLEVIKIVNSNVTANNLVAGNTAGGASTAASKPVPTVGLTALNECGISSVYFSKGSKRVLAAGLDGSVSVYHVLRKQLEYASCAGHTETIFDCKFSPLTANIFCSASYDGTVKLWNTHDLSLIKTIPVNGEVVYCLEWSPKANMIATVTNSGALILHDVETSRELGRYMHHTKPSYCVAWNKLTDHLICTTSSDHYLVIMNVDEAALYDINNANVPLGSRRKGDTKKDIAESNISYRFKHPAPVFGCAWCPTHAPIIASCCQDGKVRIFNHNLKVQLVAVMLGHTARVFSCAWSPLLPSHFATGADDCSVIVWEVNLSKALTLDITDYTQAPKLSPKQVLNGHSQNVRALHWNSEHKNLLLSGSWDASIRLWDVVTGTCLYTLSDHIADVYAIVAHPERPFTYLTSSRDTTIRMWELEGVFTRLRYNAVFDCSFNRVLDGKAGGSNKTGTLIADEGDDDDDADAKVVRVDDDDSMTLSLSTGPKQSPAEIIVGDSNKDHDSNKLATLKEAVQQFDGTTCAPASAKLVTLLTPKLYGNMSKLIAKSLKKAESKSDKPSGPKIARGIAESRSFDAKDIAAENASPLNHSAAASQLDPLELAKNYYKIYTFFNGSSSGVMDCWEIILTILHGRSTANHNTKKGLLGSLPEAGMSTMAVLTGNTVKLLRPANLRLVLHESEVLTKARNEARRLESLRGAASHLKNKMHNSEANSKTEDQLRYAALCFARAGEFQKYCSIMVDIGDWQAALAMAPAVSHDYWKSLAYRYAQHLITASVQSESCVPYLLGTGRDTEAVDFYLQRSDNSSAMVVSKMSQQRTDLIPDYTPATGTGVMSTVNPNASMTKNRFSPVTSMQGGQPVKHPFANPSPARSTPGTGSTASVQSRGPSSQQSQGGANRSQLSLTGIDFESVTHGDEIDHDDDSNPTSPSNSSNTLTYYSNNYANSSHHNLVGPGGVALSHSGPSLPSLPSIRERTENEVQESRTVVKGVASHAATSCLHSAKPILAAAQYLSVEDIPAALTVLSNNGENDLAYAIALVFEHDVTPYVVEMADKCACLNAVDLAVDMLASLSVKETAELEIGLLCSRYCSESKHQQIVALKGLKEQKVWLEEATEEENIGSDAEAVVSYTIARQFGKAVTIGLRFLKRQLRDPWDLTVATKKLIRGLKHCKATELDEPQRMLFLCYMLWFSSHEAFSQCLYDTAVHLLSLLVNHAAAAVFHIPEVEIKCQLLGCMVYAKKKKDAQILVDMLCKTEFRAGSPLAVDNAKVCEALETLTNLMNDKNTSNTASATTAASLTIKTPVAGPGGVGMGAKTALHTSLEAVWGNSTSAILRELQTISDHFALPSLSNTNGKRSTPANMDKLGSISTSSNPVVNAAQSASILQGSLLPAANQQLKSLVSVISSGRIQGTSVQLSEQDSSFASVNEAAAWRRVNPFSPLMSGDILY